MSLLGADMASIIWILSIVTGEWSVDASRAILKGKAFLTEREGRGNSAVVDWS